jgi:hypothetical protein
MNDPHVESLVYELKTAEGLHFENAPALEGETTLFHYRIDAGLLTVQPKDHFPSVKDARRVIYPFLDAWELDFALDHGRRDLQFVYERVNIIDRNPPPPDDSGLYVSVGDAISANDKVFPPSAKGVAIRKQYPRTPVDLPYSFSRC